VPASRSSKRVVRRGGTTGRRTDSCSANGCQIPQHVSVIVLRADDVTERGLNCQQPLDWAAAGVPQPGDNQPYLRPYHSIVAAGLATTPHATGGFAASRKSCRFSRTSMPMAVRVSKVALPRCGSSTALSSSINSCGTSGSCS
jgi:hypothetical protein